MLQEVLAALPTVENGLYLDATFGRGGYSRALLARKARVIGLDRDPAAVAEGEKLAKDNPRFTMLRGSFGTLDIHLASAKVDFVDGIAFDLGVSSPQLDEAERGFSFSKDGPLDMRMNPDEGESAADLVNTRDEKDLADLIWTYGEDRHSRRIAKAIVTARSETPFTRTLQLAAVVRSAVRPSKDGIDPATRTFQALRIAVNDELGELERGLLAAEKVLKPGGHLAVVSFHSLEDRIVKNFLRERGGRIPNPSRHMPAAAAASPTFRLTGPQPVKPGEEECRHNPRARSARLRAAERTDIPLWKGGTP
jgi:16S rRNA (cytosine1402-N4)-methyltransferase